MAPLLSAALVSAMQAVVPADDIAEEFQHHKENDQIQQATPQFIVARATTAAIPEIKHIAPLLFSLSLFFFAGKTTGRPVSLVL